MKQYFFFTFSLALCVSSVLLTACSSTEENKTPTDYHDHTVGPSEISAGRHPQGRKPREHKNNEKQTSSQPPETKHHRVEKETQRPEHKKPQEQKPQAKETEPKVHEQEVSTEKQAKPHKERTPQSKSFLLPALEAEHASAFVKWVDKAFDKEQEFLQSRKQEDFQVSMVAAYTAKTHYEYLLSEVGGEPEKLEKEIQEKSQKLNQLLFSMRKTAGIDHSTPAIVAARERWQEKVNENSDE